MEWHEPECVNRDLSVPVLELFLFDLDGFQVFQSLIRPKVMDFLNWALDFEREELWLDQVEAQVNIEVVQKFLKEFRYSVCRPQAELAISGRSAEGLRV